MSGITIDRVVRRFGDFNAVDGVDVVFPDGEVTCLLGPSGCGKTTLMRMVAGLETPTSGRILFGDRDVTGLSAAARRIGMVFQYPVMYPTLSVAENVALPIRHDRKVDAAERERRVDEVLDVVGLRALAGAFIEELDAGTRQKVAVARAVARHSEVVLFDEPTTNVEVSAKLALIRALKAVTLRLRQTIVYVTHDQTEAMTLADRIALMRAGRIEQFDRPHRLYALPRTEFGAWFLGNPGMNLIPAELRGDTIVCPILDAPLPAPAGLDAGMTLALGIRPELMRMTAEAGPGSVPATLVEQAIGIAGRYLTTVRLGDLAVKVTTTGRPPAAVGGTVHIAAPRDHLIVFADGVRISPPHEEGLPDAP